MDFFSNIIKTTLNKVEQSTGQSKDNDEQNDDKNQLKNDTKTKKKICVDGDAFKSSDDDTIGDGSAHNRVRRSSSGDTSGPDDNVNETIDDPSQDEPKDGRKGSASEAVGQKALESAKYFGNFLYNVANRAGQSVTATAKQLKHSVEQSGIISDFTKEQHEFIKEHGGKIETGDAPWVGCEDEAKVKEQVLSLSQDKRNFVRSPPSGVQFQFDSESAYPVALALLKDDPNLSKMRFEIVPKLVNEETFWRNYFYRVSLIKQSTQMSSLTGSHKKGWSSSRSSSGEGPDDPNDTSPTGDAPEFISDSFQANDTVSAEDLRKGLRQLGMGSDDKDKYDLEEELSKDLQEFEVVAGDDVNIDDEELEKELAQLES